MALLDQRVVAGLGNIYASEALHLAGLSPFRRASTLATPAGAPRAGCARLAAAIKSVLRARDRPKRLRALSRLAFPRLRPRRRALPDGRLRRHDRARLAGRTLDVLLSGLSAMISLHRSKAA